MMKPIAEKALTEWRAVNSRLLLAKFKSMQCNMSVIVFYAPTNDSPEERKDKYKEELRSVIDEIQERYMKIAIDHIETTKERRRTLRNVRTYRGADIGSDHHLFIATLKLKLKAANSNVARISRYDATKLKEDDYRETFVIECRNRFAVLETLRDKGPTINEKWYDIKSLGCEVLGHGVTRRKPQISKDTCDTIKRRQRKKLIVESLRNNENYKIEHECMNYHMRLDVRINRRMTEKRTEYAMEDEISSEREIINDVESFEYLETRISNKGYSRIGV
ncbi:uncharacterized protein [Palaemon carinicauda]|uniref:uncharacterized protein n=1 Tax=Palaemon carinicauda TaxID=392227 RepID=UPI0035B699FA